MFILRLGTIETREKYIAIGRHRRQEKALVFITPLILSDIEEKARITAEYKS